MRFDTIMTTIESSDADDWVRVENFYEDKHSSFYVLREDVSITLAFGADHNEAEGWDHESWSHGFPDRKVYGEYLDVRYNGTTIHRDLILSVDGHRAYLPSGSIIGDQERGVVGMAVTQTEVARARLIDRLSGHQEFDTYLSRAGITLK